MSLTNASSATSLFSIIASNKRFSLLTICNAAKRVQRAQRENPARGAGNDFRRRIISRRERKRAVPAKDVSLFQSSFAGKQFSSSHHLSPRAKTGCARACVCRIIAMLHMFLISNYIRFRLEIFHCFVNIMKYSSCRLRNKRARLFLRTPNHICFFRAFISVL